MSNQKKIHEFTQEKEGIVKKSQKHDVNLQKNTTIHFQIGMVMCLLAVFGLLEMKFESTIPNIVDDLAPVDEIAWVDVPLIKTKVVELPEAPIHRKSKKMSLVLEVVPDDTPENPFKVEVEKKVKPLDLSHVNLTNLVDKPIDDDEPVNFVAIEVAPIYPGCEKEIGNEMRKKCMSRNITKLIHQKFDGGDIATEYGLTGKQRIDVQFTIDKTGNVTNIKTRAPISALESEAERVIRSLPKMKPGKQRDKNVGVIYDLPIIFQVE